MKRLLIILVAVTLSACVESEPTIYDQVYRDFPGAVDWYTKADIDGQAELACNMVAETGGSGPEWQAGIMGLWAGTPHERQSAVFGDDPAQVVTYFRILTDYTCPIGS